MGTPWEGDAVRKLLKLKEWVSVADAAQHLTTVSGEEVTEADLLQLALTGDLTISVYFITEVMGQRCLVLPAISKIENVRITEEMRSKLTAPPNKNKPLEADPYAGYRTRIQSTIDKTHYIISPDDIQNPTLIKGVWDLAMIGGETDYVRNKYMTRIGKRKITPSLDDLLITNQEKDEFYSLLRRERVENKGLCHVAAARMPDDILLAVRTTALLHFQERLLADNRQPEDTEKPLHPSERRSVGQIIAALAAMEGLDICSPYSAAEVLRAAAATNGLEMPSSDETIVKFLKMAATKPIDK